MRRYFLLHNYRYWKNSIQTCLQSAPFPIRFFSFRFVEYCTQRKRPAGFTIIELVIVVAIIAGLSAIGIPTYLGYVHKARITVATSEIYQIQKMIILYEYDYKKLPLDLTNIRGGGWKDPWGNPYQYLNFSTITGKGKGKMRKDRFLVPINSTYDLCSMGPDGKTNMPLTAKASRDDIIRASDGEYVGPAAYY
ncbi:type II secretion system protein [Thermodesulfobacteriota bacterium]